MVMVAENQGNLNCNPLQLPQKKSKIITMNTSEDNSPGNAVKHVVTKESTPMSSRKREPGTLLVDKRAKKQKMDFSLRFHLRKILKELMNYDIGPMFSEPVDPVKLRIPDYFSVVKKPMDLGMILRKLEEGMYSSADEVVADVRLTFSNAMLYFHRRHDAHYWAEKLDAMFSRKLNSLEAKLTHAKENDGEARVVDCMGKNGPESEHIVEPIGLNKSPLPIKHGTWRLMSRKEKQKVKLELVKSKQMIETLQAVFQKFGLAGLNEERLDSYVDSADDATLWKLKREVKEVFSAKDGKAPAGLSIDSTESGSSCVTLKHRCLRNGEIQGSANVSDLSSERSEEQGHGADSKLEHKVKHPSESCTSECVNHSDGPAGVNKADSFRLSTPASDEGSKVPMSPKKALCVAMLKSRYADTIFKATHHELLEHNEKSDPLRMQQKTERLEREQRKEKDKIAAEIKAAEAASLRMHMRQRNAARIAVEKHEKSAQLDDNLRLLDDLKMIGCGYLYTPGEAIHHGNRLQQLGLFCKVDCLEDEDTLLDIEEGQILS